MYRQNSFSTKRLPVPPPETEPQAPVVEEGDHIINLTTTGKFMKKNIAGEGGLIVAFRNHQVRNKLWPIATVCCNSKSGAFAIADERGQVYKMSVQHNVYNSIRLASTGVSAMCFLSQHKNHLVLAYESGSIVVIDAHTKDIIGNLQVKTKAVARIIQSHPSELKVAIASDDKTLAIWDLNSCQCVQSMQCEEAIVDVRYELGGRVIVVVLEHTGAYLYSTDASAELRMHLKLPASEPAPKWTAYCAYNLFMDAQGSNGRQKAATPAALNVLLASSTSLIYSWHACAADLLTPAGEKKAAPLRVAGEVVPPSHLVGIVELPIKNRVAVSMQLLNPNASNSGTLGSSNLPSAGAASFSAAADLPPRILVMTQQGGMLIVDIEGFQVRSAGFFTVKADLDPTILHGSAAGNETGWLAQTVGSRRPSAVVSSTGSLGGASNKSVYGKVHAAKNLVVVVGCDGLARVFDIRAALGTGSLCGTVLRSRVPKVAKADDGFAPLTAAHAGAHSRSTATSKSVTHNVHHTHPPAHSRANPVTSPSIAHYMTHPADRPSTAHSHRAESLDSSPAVSHTHYERVNSHHGDSAGMNYDFILHDSQDGEDAHGAGLRRSGFRSASTGKAGPAGTFGRSGNTATATTSRSARAASVTSRSSETSRRPSSLARDRIAGKIMQSFVATHKAQKTEIDVSNMPLFELAALTPKESQVNVRKLTNFLELNGEYPARYRPLVWRFLLKLPENTVAFSDLVNRGVHPAFENLYDTYPIQNRKVFDRLQNLCSQMAHWSPILADAPYLPALVFPFTLVYNTDELAALETSVAIMMWWGHSWHALHPNPPIHIIDAIDGLLKFHDSKLYSHLKSLKVAPGVLGWAMMSTLFTEVLSRTNWLKLMDNLFCHFGQIAAILLAPVALMKELKGVLLTCDTAAQVNLLLHSQQNVNMLTVNKMILDWLHRTPPKFFSAVATRHLDGIRLELGPGHVTDEIRLAETDQANENLALASGRPIFPLTKGRYPVYDGFPAHVLDMQIRERNKIMALGKEVTRRESVLAALQQKLAEVESDHTSWMNKHKNASDAELRHQTEMMVREREHLAELQRIEEEISRQRLATLTSLEAAAKDEMELMDRAAFESKQLLQEGELHMKEKMNIQLSLQKHREMAELAEVATHERIRQLQMRRVREDWVKNVADSMKSREEEFSVRDAILNEQWRKEDDRQHLLREQRTRQLKVFEEEARMAALQEDLALRMQRLQMERDARVIEIERVRALRLAKEQAEEALEAAERSSIVLRKHELLNASEQSAILSEQSVKQAEAKLLETVGMIQTESQKLLDAERVHTLRQNKARMQARQAQLRQEWAEKSGRQLHEVISAQGELQGQMLKLQQAALRSELDRDLAYSTGTATTSSQFEEARRQIETLEDSVLVQQRQRFEEIQEYMRAQAQQAQQAQYQAAAAQGAQATAQRADTRGSPGGDEPVWDRPPSAIPAPLSGAGIGYGIRPPAPPAQQASASPVAASLAARREEQAADLSDIEHEAKQYKIPLDKALKVAGTALKTHGGDYAEEEDDDDYEGDGYGDAYSASLRQHSEPRYGTSSAGAGAAVSARSLQQDALDLAAASEAYSFRGESETTSRSVKTGTRTFTTTTSQPRGLHAMTADSLRQLAAQSLKNLQATRVMNRDEVAQERQEHTVYQQSPSSTPGTTPGTTTAAPAVSSQGASEAGTRRTSVGPSYSYADPPVTSARGLPTPPGSPPRRGVVVDSRTALWALEDGSDEEGYA